MTKQEKIREGLIAILAKRNCRTLVTPILSYLNDNGACLLEERLQRYSEKTGHRIKPRPYKILTSLIAEVK